MSEDRHGRFAGAPRRAPDDEPPRSSGFSDIDVPDMAVAAGFWIRLAAVLADGIILTVVSLVLTAIFGPAAALLAIAAGVVYTIGFWTVSGATPGKMLFGLKVVTEEGDPIALDKAALRLLGYWVTVLTLGIGYLMIAFRKDKRGLHDLIAVTTVEAEPGRPTIVGWCLIFAVVTFGLLWFLGPRDTAFSFQVSQANNILHGHLDMDPQYTKNIGVLERVLYDGDGFCFPPGDPQAELVSEPRFSEDCKTYMQHSIGPALMVIPGVLVWGNQLNQALVSVVIGALTAPVVFLVSRHMSTKLLNQLLLTVLMVFGTIFWWVAANGGVWFFAHTTATFFLFGGIYFAVARPNPLLAGACLGASFLCRPTTIVTGLFFVVMFSPFWLRPPAPGRTLWQRIDLAPAWSFAAGIAPFLFTGMLANYLRFDDPLETGYGYTEQTRQTHLEGLVYQHGLFDVSYIQRHPPVMLEQTPVFQKNGPYILPSWFGMAMWITTPAFLLAYFPNIKVDRRIWVPAAAALAIAAGIILSRGIVRAWDAGWATTDIPLGVHLLPFWALTVLAVIWASLQRDRLVLACWAAIIPMALFLFTFAATGWAQHGYRYGLDFTPFLWLLVARTIGDELKWYHIGLIAAGVAVNLMAVLWLYQFEPNQTNGWSWVTF